MTKLEPGDVLFVRVLTAEGYRVQLYTVSEVDATGPSSASLWSGVYVRFSGLESRYSAAFLAGLDENKQLVHAIENGTREPTFSQVKSENLVQLTVVETSRPSWAKTKSVKVSKTRLSAKEVVED